MLHQPSSMAIQGMCGVYRDLWVLFTVVWNP